MKKFQFTAAGFTQLQQQLYALPDLQLQEEAAAVQNDFDQWMATHFELNEQQLLFLIGIDYRLHRLLAALTGFAIDNRLPVLLVKAEPPTLPEKEQGKIIWPKSTLSAVWGIHTAYIASGTLEIHLNYEV